MNAEADLKTRIELFKAVIASIQSALKALLLINSGAAVSLLTFVGHLISSDRSQFVRSFANALLWAIIGIALVAIAYVASCVSLVLLSEAFNHLSASKKAKESADEGTFDSDAEGMLRLRCGRCGIAATLVIWILSLAAFVVSCCICLRCLPRNQIRQRHEGLTDQNLHEQGHALSWRPLVKNTAGHGDET